MKTENKPKNDIYFVSGIGSNGVIFVKKIPFTNKQIKQLLSEPDQLKFFEIIKSINVVGQIDKKESTECITFHPFIQFAIVEGWLVENHDFISVPTLDKPIFHPVRFLMIPLKNLQVASKFLANCKLKSLEELWIYRPQFLVNPAEVIN